MNNNFESCPICQNKFTIEPSYKGSDLLCRGVGKHFFGIRKKDNELLAIKVNILDDIDNNNYFIRINFDNNTTEIWSRHSSDIITINSVLQINFTNMTETKLLDKIKNILMFA